MMWRRLCQTSLHRLAQEAREVLFFPTPRAAIAGIFALAAIEFVRMHATPTTGVDFVRHHGVQHLVVKYVLEKPKRNKGLIEARVYPDDTIFFLDGSENEILFRAPLPALAPEDFVAAQPPAEMARVYAIENLAQIEMAPLVLKIELLLHGQPGVSQFSLCFLRHLGSQGIA